MGRRVSKLGCHDKVGQPCATPAESRYFSQQLDRAFNASCAARFSPRLGHILPGCDKLVLSLRCPGHVAGDAESESIQMGRRLQALQLVDPRS